MKFLQVLLMPLFFAALACGPGDVRLKFESEKRFARFQTKLQKELMGAVARGGFKEAVQHCRIASPSLEKKAGTEKFILRRVSDRPRNPDHAPDAFERRVLKQWQAVLARGGKPTTVGERMPEGYRVMKPIRINGGMCLKCHGVAGQLDRAALEQIRQLYPADKATGYRAGELRGAFSAVWKK